MSHSKALDLDLCPPDLARIGARLEKNRTDGMSLRHVRERDLEAAAFAAYREGAGVAPVKIVIPTPGWPSLGRSTTDLVVEHTPGSRQPRTIAELKWIVPDGQFKIWEAVWDLFKMALQSRIDGIEDAYLITGAPPRAWANDPCADIFLDKSHDVADLCTRVLKTSRARYLVWNELLTGGSDRYPEWVPSPIRTEPLPSALVDGGPDQWELRGVRVLVPEDHELVPFPNGWPHGKRPDSATQPAEIPPRDRPRPTSPVRSAATDRPEPEDGSPATTINTRSGLTFDFADPSPDSIKVEDIAGGLSLAPRFGGQALEFRSVAEHAIAVAELTVRMGSPDLALTALHHDSHEAYACDIPRPLKLLLEPAYGEITARLDRAIAAALDLPSPAAGTESARVIKQADDAMFIVEAERFLPGECPRPDVPDHVVNLARAVLGTAPHLSPEEARTSFLEAHDRFSRR